MCDCGYLSSRLLPRESPVRGFEVAASPAALRRRLVSGRGRRGCWSFSRQRTVISVCTGVLAGGSFFVRVGQHNTKGHGTPGAFPPDAQRFIRAVRSARLRDDEGGLDSADLLPARFSEVDDTSVPSNFDVLQLKRELGKEERGDEIADSAVDENNLIPSEDPESIVSDSGQKNSVDRIWGSRRGRQVLRRSSLLAKQVISVHSARSLGFISQLWVDTISWTVVIVEVRPNLLSGEIERLLLEDLEQVGDVVLVQDESVMENELKMIGLDTLVGYNVVTPARRKIGKVRGYSFNVNSGAVESLELDSLGISVIPSTLVSTYSLMVEDVIEVASDCVVVEEDAESRLQRLTKTADRSSLTVWFIFRQGLWGDRSGEASPAAWDHVEEFSEMRRRARRPERRRGGRRFSPEGEGAEGDWDLPMDF
ncbi:unnamed protein product [Spirodela intermedia]|uniref:Uncharacterized protein n=1 Tax=Spirodela intermedia TaxID=51605 RepID=A0A7I8JGE9_SPIIN|nr:unnamed protein product [Spirodela intermedia]CAA6669229.1 unnamed protein product [Spirodela intermedia]